MLSLFRPASFFFRFANSPALLAIGGLPYLHDSGQNINFVALSRAHSLLSLFYLIPVFFSPSLSLCCLSERGPRSSDIKPFRWWIEHRWCIGCLCYGNSQDTFNHPLSGVQYVVRSTTFWRSSFSIIYLLWFEERRKGNNEETLDGRRKERKKGKARSEEIRKTIAFLVVSSVITIFNDIYSYN